MPEFAQRQPRPPTARTLCGNPFGQDCALITNALLGKGDQKLKVEAAHLCARPTGHNGTPCSCACGAQAAPGQILVYPTDGAGNERGKVRA